MAKKGLTLDERRELIKALFKDKNKAQQEEALTEPEEDEEEILEKQHVKRKARHKKQQEGRIRPQGKR